MSYIAHPDDKSRYINILNGERRKRKIKFKIYKRIERLSYSLNFYIQRIRKILKHYEFKLKINLDN